jgi:hypothetical protein
MLAEPFPELADERPLSSATDSAGLAEFDFDNTFPQHLVRVLSTIGEVEEFAGNLSTMVNQARQEGRSLTLDSMLSGTSGIVKRSLSQFSWLPHTGKVLLLL